MFNRDKMNPGFMCELSIITEPVDSISAKLDIYAYDFLATKERKTSVSASFMLDFICVPLSRRSHEAPLLFKWYLLNEVNPNPIILHHNGLLNCSLKVLKNSIP